ncbi:unnamed protein product [Rhodiola kirilowii]
MFVSVGWPYRIVLRYLRNAVIWSMPSSTAVIDRGFMMLV